MFALDFAQDLSHPHPYTVEQQKKYITFDHLKSIF